MDSVLFCEDSLRKTTGENIIGPAGGTHERNSNILLAETTGYSVKN